MQAGPLVAKSAVQVKDVDKGKAATDGVDQWRTSETHFYSSHGDPTMVEVERRVMRLTRMNVSHAEEAQVAHMIISLSLSLSYSSRVPSLVLRAGVAVQEGRTLSLAP